MKFKKTIAIMAVVLTLVASAPAAFAATESELTSSPTVSLEDSKSEENILIEFDLETGQEKEVIVEPGRDLDYYSPGAIGADVPSMVPDISDQGASSKPLEGRKDGDILTPSTRLSAICQLKVTYPNNQVAYSTGFIVGSHTIVTAGHCVYNSSRGGLAKSIEITPKKNGTEQPYGTFPTTKAAVPKKWSSDANLKYDYGIITANTDIQSIIGGAKMGYRANSGTGLINQIRRYQGYPAGYGDRQMYIQGKIYHADDHYLFSDFNARNGFSGSPLFENKLSGTRVAEGILSGGDRIENGSPTATRAVRINQEIYDAISLYAK